MDVKKTDAFTYASRKAPEFFSLRMVVCSVCDTAYATHPPSADDLATVYREAAFDTAPEELAAAETYDCAIAPELELAGGGAAVEVGCGTGALLPLLRERGFSPVIGFEPSLAATAAASDEALAMIRVEPFNTGSLEPDSLSVICCFQTIEHLPDPSGFTRNAFTLLRPGGRLIIIAHNRRATLNRLLGRRSPIIDIEHLQLYSDQALEALMERSGFETASPRSLVNRYPVRYWLRLLPFPLNIRNKLIAIIDWLHLGSIMLSFNVGNQLAVGVKPERSASP